MGSQPDKIKILFTIPNFDTAGSGKALLKIAERLDPDCFEPEICCMHDRGAFFKVVQASGIPVHIFPYTADMSKRLKGLQHVWKISRFFKSINPDIIHSFHYAPDYSEALAARLAGIKWVYTKKNMNWGGSSKNGWLLRSWLANGIVAQNTDMLKDFFPGWKKVTLIPRGVDVGEFFPAPPPQAVLDSLHINPGKRLIVCVANLVPVKGVEVLLEAFARIARRHSHVHLAIVGDDQSDYGSMLKEKAKTIAAERIFFTGKVLNVVDYLRAADVFVLPTKFKGEGSPLALLESMATGKCVVASDVPGIRDQISNFPELLFEPINVDLLSDKIDALLKQSDSERAELGENLRREVFSRYTIEKEVGKHEFFYHIQLDLPFLLSE